MPEIPAWALEMLADAAERALDRSAMVIPSASPLAAGVAMNNAVRLERVIHDARAVARGGKGNWR